MSKKATKKASSPKSRKRPKSVLQKAWATRRKNKAHRASPAGKMAAVMYGDNTKLAGLAGLLSENSPSDSELTPKRLSALEVHTNRIFRAAGLMDDEKAKDAVRNRLMHEVDDMLLDARYKGVSEGLKDGAVSQQKIIDESALCGIVAMWGLYSRSPAFPSHAPFVISRIALDAVVSTLMDLGYTPDGKVKEPLGKI